MADLSNDEQFNISTSSSGTTNINSVKPIEFVRDAYTGKNGFSDGAYLVKFPRETEFSERQGYSIYTNYFKKIVHALTDPLFKRSPTYESDNKIWKLFLEDCDGSGTSFVTMMKRFARKAKRDGTCFLVMDSDSEQPDSVAEAEANRTFPYVYIREARKVVAYSMDKFRNLEWIAFKEDSDSTVTDEAPETVYRRWDRVGWQVYKEYGKDGVFSDMISDGIHNLGIVPMVPIYTGDFEDNELLADPPLYNIALICADIYNTQSELRAVMRNQGFNMLTAPSAGGKSPRSIVTGLKSILWFPKDSTHKPDVLTFDPAVMEPYFKRLEDNKKDIYQLAELASVTGVTEKTGIAKQWDFRATNAVLQDMARLLEEHGKRVMNLFGLKIDADLDGKCEFSEDFGVVDVDSDIDRHERLTDQGMPLEVVKESKKRLVKNYFAELPADEVAELLESVDSMVEDEERGKEEGRVDEE